MGVIFTNGFGIGTVPNSTTLSGQWYLATGPFGFQPGWTFGVTSWPMNTGNAGVEYGTNDPNEILGGNNAGIYINRFDSNGIDRTQMLSSMVGANGTITFRQGSHHITYRFEPGTFVNTLGMYGSIAWGMGSQAPLTLVSSSNTSFNGYSDGDYNMFGGELTYNSSGIAPNNSELVTITIHIGNPEFTITSSDITAGYGNYNTYSGRPYPVALGTNGVDGYQLTYVGDEPAGAHYASNVPYVFNSNSQTIVDIFAGLVTQGLLTHTWETALWDVTWAAGSTHTTGVVSLTGLQNVNGQIYLTTLDTSDPNYDQPGNNTPALAGTYLFPATFRLRIPPVNKGGWC